MNLIRVLNQLTAYDRMWSFRQFSFKLKNIRITVRKCIWYSRNQQNNLKSNRLKKVSCNCEIFVSKRCATLHTWLYIIIKVKRACHAAELMILWINLLHYTIRLPRRARLSASGPATENRCLEDRKVFIQGEGWSWFQKRNQWMRYVAREKKKF